MDRTERRTWSNPASGKGNMPQLLLMVALALFAAPALAQETEAAAASSAVSGPNEAGKVALTEGDVRIYDTKQHLRRPNVGDALYEGDSIVTGVDGEVQFEMQDGGYIGVRPNTKMRIVRFRAEGGPDDRSVIGLLEGSFRTITGWIATAGGKNAVIRTPTASIGVRGTDHEPLVIPANSTEGEPGTYDKVNIGETEIRTARGSVRIRANHAGFVSRRGTAPPRVLDRVPGFFRPTRNEKRFEGLHERIHRQLNQLREQRIRELREHRGKLQQRQKPGKQNLRERREQMQQLREERREARRQRAENGGAAPRHERPHGRRRN